MEPDSTKLWKVVYPIYINSKKTVAEGRRIPIEKATEHPTPKEIFEACKYLGYETEIEEDKAYSRDYTQRGRVRVKFHVNPEIKNSKGCGNFKLMKTERELLVKVASLVPQIRAKQGKEATSEQITSNVKGKKKNR